LAHPLVELVGAFFFSGIIIFAFYRIQSGSLSQGGFISFIAAIALFMDPIRKFSQANIKLSQARAAAVRIFNLLEMEEEQDSGEHDSFDFQESIEIENLTFSYGDGEVIQNLNLKIEKGQKVALVGLSGSGKSTLINLLLGLYPVEKGEIRIDGVPLSNIKLQALRKMFGLVSQDIFLFHDTVEENLTLGRELTSDQVAHALQIAYAAEFIDKLPSGSKTVIGDRGTRLSGGQQQRLTIARAFLQESPIYLFDEATSALDNESEKVVQKALERLGGEKTVIAVAHRLSTIQDFDRIFVLHEGNLIEQGSHEELMQLGGEYQKLYELSQKS
jgi:subfamily B ATP-binding cassette protein MsbA